MENQRISDALAWKRLVVCLALIRGGQAVRAELIDQDFRDWVSRYGEVSKENVEKWAENSFELRFALDCQIARNPK